MEPVRVYIGYDPREHLAYRVAVDSILRHSSVPVAITPVQLERLELAGIMRRPRKWVDGGHHPHAYKAPDSTKRVARVLWDEISEAPMATEFAISRFAVPLLAHVGWAAFLDCDVVAFADIAELFALADPDRAVMCVKHDARSTGFAMGSQAMKMDGQPQTYYARKNWSSVMLFNCDHPANRVLDLATLNTRPGRDLHRFCWLDHEHLIGELPRAWNWLVGVQPRPADLKLAHFTLGGPWLPEWEPHVHDDLWLAAQANLGP